MHYVFITGGVASSLGKGIASASLASLLQLRKFKIRIRKLDPYLNVDPGTMSPYQHGEVFVLDDGSETDLDLRHYERFIDVDMKKENIATTSNSPSPELVTSKWLDPLLIWCKDLASKSESSASGRASSSGLLDNT